MSTNKFSFYYFGSLYLQNLFDINQKFLVGAWIHGKPDKIFQHRRC